MITFKCKMCGGDLHPEENATTCECEYCGSVQTIPRADNEKKGNLFNRANRLRMAAEYDKAAAVYTSITAEFPEEAEAYWGLCLCKYGIEYVEDPVTAKKIPTCHRTRSESIMDDPDFDQACENADAVAKRVYRDEAKAIDRLQQDILSVVANESPYDVFICYKETDDDGQRTEDSVLAQDIYDSLTAKGLKVFFARITLEDKLGQQYEPYIYAALHSAKVMLVIGTQFEYFDAVWVKNEWSRFLDMMKGDKSKTLIPCYKDIDAYDMPREFKNLQAQDMGKLGWLQDLTRGVMKLCGKDREKLPTAPVVQQFASSMGPTVVSLLERGFLQLEDARWNEAKIQFSEVLNIEPRNSKAYLGMTMAENKCRNQEELAIVYVEGRLSNDRNFDRVRQFDQGELSEWLSELNKSKQMNMSRLAKIRNRNKKAHGFYAVYAVLGLDGTVSSLIDTVGFKSIKDWTDIVAVTGDPVNIVGLKADGTVVAVGENEHGENNVENWTDIVAISRGRGTQQYTIGLKSNGTVVAVGNNDYNKCDVENWTDIVAITAGIHHTVGLKSDGTVVAVGNNDFDQCNVDDWTDIVAISAGLKHTVGLKSDGTVVAIGGNEDGQCNVAEWFDIVAITAGHFITVGLKSDGSVVAAGAIENFQYNFADWTDIVALIYDMPFVIGIKSNGTLRYTGSYPGNKYDFSDRSSKYSKLKLFYSIDTIDEDRIKARTKFHEERARQKLENQMLIEKIRKEKEQSLLDEQLRLKTERDKLHGLFRGSRRKEIDARLAQIESELMKL